MPGEGDGLMVSQQPSYPHLPEAPTPGRPRTNAGTDGHEHVGDGLGVIHHDGLHSSIQHADLQGPLLLSVFHGVLAGWERGISPVSCPQRWEHNE